MTSLSELASSPVAIGLGVLAVAGGLVLLGIAVDRLERIRMRQERERRK